MKINERLQKDIREKYGRSAPAEVELAIYALELAEQFKDDTEQIDHRLTKKIKELLDREEENNDS